MHTHFRECRNVLITSNNPILYHQSELWLGFRIALCVCEKKLFLNWHIIVPSNITVTDSPKFFYYWQIGIKIQVVQWIGGPTSICWKRSQKEYMNPLEFWIRKKMLHETFRLDSSLPTRHRLHKQIVFALAYDEQYLHSETVFRQDSCLGPQHQQIVFQQQCYF